MEKWASAEEQKAETARREREEMARREEEERERGEKKEEEREGEERRVLQLVADAMCVPFFSSLSLQVLEGP